jgi:DNA helicase-2/ATP-dependent DNA helicase PcrA
MPDSTIPSRFLEEIPSRLMEDLGSPVGRPQFSSAPYATPYPQRNRFRDDADNNFTGRHYNYEDEDQSSRPAAKYISSRFGQGTKSVPPSNSIDNIASFFASRGQKVPSAARPGRPKLDVPEPTGKTGLRQGSRVRHPKYGIGTVFRREGDGDDAKITVQFQQHGVKKLVEKFAQLETL